MLAVRNKSLLILPPILTFVLCSFPHYSSNKVAQMRISFKTRIMHDLFWPAAEDSITVTI